jgi:uncharacterized protein (DUF2147 family)
MRNWLVVLSLFVGLQSFAQNEILGTWYNDIKSSKIEIYEEKGLYYGRISWLEDPANSDGSTPRVDEFNEDPALAQRQLMNLVILRELKWNASEKEWQAGTIYDPNNGKTYECYCLLQEDGTLYFKGYVLGITWLGRSTVWTRA